MDNHWSTSQSGLPLLWCHLPSDDSLQLVEGGRTPWTSSSPRGRSQGGRGRGIEESTPCPAETSCWLCTLSPNWLSRYLMLTSVQWTEAPTGGFLFLMNSWNRYWTWYHMIHKSTKQQEHNNKVTKSHPKEYWEVYCKTANNFESHGTRVLWRTKSE